MVLTSFLIAMFPRELPRAKLRKQLTQTMEASTAVVAATGSKLNLNRAGSKLVLTSEAATENQIPRISGKKKTSNLSGRLASMYQNMMSYKSTALCSYEVNGIIIEILYST